MSDAQMPTPGPGEMTRRAVPPASRLLRDGATLGLLVLTALALAQGATVTSAAQAADTVTVHTATAPPTATLYYEEETRQAFEGQLQAREIREAEFNKVAEHLHLLLSDGHRVYVVYPGHEEPALQARLIEAHVPVTIEYTQPKTTSKHHTIRYIVAGVLVVALIALAVLLVVRRRRLAGVEDAAGADQGAGGGPETQ